jgi:hypothetical protein
MHGLVCGEVVAYTDVWVEIYTSCFGERVICVDEAALATF